MMEVNNGEPINDGVLVLPSEYNLRYAIDDTGG